jgi:hypothetical protein
LDEVQFEALIGVLRSLRSVRTAEAISPTRMREVLTEALPALEPDHLKLIAEAMQRIAELEDQLERAQNEARLLKDTHHSYRGYLTSIARLQAAELSAAQNTFDDQTRLSKNAEAQLQTARASEEAAESQLEALRARIPRTEGELSAANSALSEHAGAELPLLEQRATELADTAKEAQDRAEQAAQNADEADAQARASTLAAQQSQHHLGRLTDHLQEDSRAIGSEPAFDRLIEAFHELTATEPDVSPNPLDLEQVCSTPIAWTEARTQQIRHVQEVLRQHGGAQQAELTLNELRLGAEAEESQARDAAEEASQARQQAESTLLEALSTWAVSLQHLDRPPEELTAPSPDSTADRLSPERFDAWLAATAESARHRIDLTGKKRQEAADDARAAEAAKTAAEARAEHSATIAHADKATHLLSQVRARIEAEAEADSQRRARAESDHLEELRATQASVRAVEETLRGAEEAARDTARGWLTKVHQWRDSLTHLSPDAIHLPTSMDRLSPEALTGIDPMPVLLAARTAYTTAIRVLERKTTTAHSEVERLEKSAMLLDDELAQTRRTSPTPVAPLWRSRRPQDGVPLWALVDFADHLSSHDADLIEGSLLVSGLLDALVTPEGKMVTGDLTITALTPARGATLANVLCPEQHQDVPVELIRRILRAIPIDANEGVPVPGVLTQGVVTAACPAGYRAAFIGRTAREHARQQRVAALEAQHAEIVAALASAQAALDGCAEAETAAAAELDGLPSHQVLIESRQQTTDLTSELNSVKHLAEQRTARTKATLQQILDELRVDETERREQLAQAQADHRHAQEQAQAADDKARRAERHVSGLMEIARNSKAARLTAAEAQDTANTEQSSFPTAPLADVRSTQHLENQADEMLNRARATVLGATERHSHASETVKDTLRALNRAATLSDGTLLPTAQSKLDDHAEAISRLAQSINACSSAAERCTYLLGRAVKDHQTAVSAHATANRATSEAVRAELISTNALAQVKKTRELHGAEYEELLRTRQSLVDQLRNEKDRLESLHNELRRAGEKATAAQTTLDGIAPRRVEAEHQRDQCLRLLNLLIEEKLAVLPDDLPADDFGRPAHLTAGLSWTRRLLSDMPPSKERLASLIRRRDRALTKLEGSARTASSALAKFDRHVTLTTIEGTNWRRALIAAPDSIRGDDLHEAIEALHASINQLEGDLRDDVKQTMKTGMFTKLRRDIQIRKQAAHELVRQIRSTLSEVRTGVANVGVQVNWDVRQDDDAKDMVELITQKPSEETFDRMYKVLRQRMEEKAGDPWPDRVAHTFDYRAWHEWDIFVTHSSFSEGTAEVFKKVNARSNPLESLSTGERRLATMLPLLAAAWSMYSGDSYRGPRLLSIDEIDAAFDESNLRQILNLLRLWDFDVLATTPSISPLIKRETRRAVVHEVVATGRHRITVPWLWEGHGEPQPFTLDLETPS